MMVRHYTELSMWDTVDILWCVLSCTILTGIFVVICNLFHVLLLLVKVSLIVFLHYGMDVDVSLSLSQLVALGKNHVHY